MSNLLENEWTRFHRVKDELSRLPSSEVPTRIAQLRRDGERATIISRLELHYGLTHQLELQPGQRLANRYVIREKIGEGGMGVVYVAVQELTQQEVAVKVVHPGLVSPALIKRFLEEIRALGKLQHDHIVRVFDADYHRQPPSNQDLLFYAMQLVRGLPLVRWVNEAHPTVEARMECFIQICEAVHYAHCHGVIHRDLKPDNILVDQGARPAILDFGLAQIMDIAFETPKEPRVAEGQTFLQVSGTPAFMSPERWDGHAGGVPADVFALGVLLHEILTGTRPWQVAPDASIDDLRHAICHFSIDQWKPHPALSRPLTRLLGSMLAPDPAARPASAVAVTNVLRDLLARSRLKRRIRRAAPVGACVAAAIITLTATLGYHAWIIGQHRESERQLNRALGIVNQRSHIDTLAQVIKALPPNPKLRHSQDEWRDAVLKAMATWNLRTDHAVPLPEGFEPKAANRQGTCFFGRTLSGAWEVIQRANGQWSSRRFLGEHDVVRARLNPAQSQLALLLRKGGLVVWNWYQDQETPLLPDADPDTQFKFSPDGNYLACSAEPPVPDGERLSAVKVFNARTGKEVAHLFEPGDQKEPGTYVYVRSRPIADLAFSPDGNLLATWSHESLYLLIWDWPKERRLPPARHANWVAAAAWRPLPTGDKMEIATMEANGRLLVWGLSSAADSGAHLAPRNAIEQAWAADNFQGELAWTPGGDALAAVDDKNQRMEILALDAGEGRFRVTLGNQGAKRMQWVSGGLMTSIEGRSEWVPFDSDPPVRHILRIPGFTPDGLVFNPTGTVLAAADSLQIVFFSMTPGVPPHSMPMTLSGPIDFDAHGDLFVYDKRSGPMRLKDDIPATFPSFVGLLKMNGMHLVFSRGTNIYVPQTPSASNIRGAEPAFSVEAQPRYLAINETGDLVGASWEHPLRAASWRLHEGRWSLDSRITNAPVIAGLPSWNSNAPLTILAVQQKRAGKEALASTKNHIEDGDLLFPAMGLPLVARAPESGQGVHLDYLAPESCIHVGRLPFDLGHGLPAPPAFSHDGMRLAVANSRGEIHLWDLRRTFHRLAKLQLGIDEIKLDSASQSEEAHITTETSY